MLIYIVIGITLITCDLSMLYPIPIIHKRFILTLPSLRSFLIQSRNERTEISLREHGVDDRVFCVSNDLYSEHRRSGLPHADEYLDLSRIPQLRRYCQLVPAEAQFRFAAAFLEHRAPAVLRSVKQWTLAGLDNVTAEKAKALRQVLSNAEGVFRQV